MSIALPLCTHVPITHLSHVHSCPLVWKSAVMSIALPLCAHIPITHLSHVHSRPLVWKSAVMSIALPLCTHVPITHFSHVHSCPLVWKSAVMSIAFTSLYTCINYTLIPCTLLSTGMEKCSHVQSEVIALPLCTHVSITHLSHVHSCPLVWKSAVMSIALPLYTHVSITHLSHVHSCPLVWNEAALGGFNNEALQSFWRPLTVSKTIHGTIQHYLTAVCCHPFNPIPCTLTCSFLSHISAEDFFS